MSTATLERTTAKFDPDTLPHVEAELGFVEPPPAGETAISTDYVDPGRVNVFPKPVRCVVRDARPIKDQLSIDREGFQLIKHRSKIAGYNGSRDPEELRMKYLDEMAPVIQALTGASWVVPRDESVRVRSSKVSDLPVNGVEKTAGRVHRDYTPASADALFEMQMAKGRVPRRPYSRMSIVQTWRCITPPPQDRPLVVVDASTYDPKDILLSWTRFSANPAEHFETSCGLHNPNQNYYYFSDMEEDDVIIMKGHDTLYPGSMYAFHTSMDLSHVPHAVPRESIESRYFVFFE